jgi:hypothetical protein
MMIESLNTVVAVVAVGGAWRSVYFAVIAVFYFHVMRLDAHGINVERTMQGLAAIWYLS